MERGRIRILVVDDSAYHRRTLTKLLSQDPDLEVIGTAADGEEAIKKVVNLQPDVVTLDLEMPRMDGFTFLRWLMKSQPRPVLIVTSRESNQSVFKALDLGAVDFVVKPVKYASIKLGSIGDEMIAKIKQIAPLKVDVIPAKLQAITAPAPSPRIMPPVSVTRYEMVAIGASTGGPPALQNVLSRLPKDLPAGIVISQHMPAGFTRLFAERLDRLVGVAVKEAVDGEPVEMGVAHICPGGKHLVLERAPSGKVRLRTVDPEPKDRYTPSIDAMMASAAAVYHERLIGVLLTGMGDDGVLGMKAIKEKGGLTIAESEETCIIYGMPREAVRSGAVDVVLPLSQIGEMVANECRDKGESRGGALPVRGQTRII